MTNVQIHPPFHVPHVLRLGKTEKTAQIFVIYPFLLDNNILNHNRIERRWFAKYYLASTYTSFSFASSSYVKSIWFHNYTSSNYFYLIKINQFGSLIKKIKNWPKWKHTYHYDRRRKEFLPIPTISNEQELKLEVGSPFPFFGTKPLD